MAEMGYSLVRLLITGQQTQRLQVMVERDDGRGLTVDDCATLSRSLSMVLDEVDAFDAPYTLEVSSPGIERPLVKLADFDRFRGSLARIDVRGPVAGRRRFTGRLLGHDDGDVRMEVNGAEVRLPFDLINRAKLVMDDAVFSRSTDSNGAVRHSQAE